MARACVIGHRADWQACFYLMQPQVGGVWQFTAGAGGVWRGSSDGRLLTRHGWRCRVWGGHRGGIKEVATASEQKQTADTALTSESLPSLAPGECAPPRPCPPPGPPQPRQGPRREPRQRRGTTRHRCEVGTCLLHRVQDTRRKKRLSLESLGKIWRIDLLVCMTKPRPVA